MSSSINDGGGGGSDKLQAVRIKSGFKSYGKYHVLKNLDLNVPQGAM